MEICCNCGQVVYQNALGGRFPSQNYLEIISSVAMKYDIPVSEIMSENRRSYVAAARQEAYYLMYKSGLSSSQIGRFMKRDHTSILHGIKRHEYRLAQEIRWGLNNRPTSGGEYADGPMAAAE